MSLLFFRHLLRNRTDSLHNRETELETNWGLCTQSRLLFPVVYIGFFLSLSSFPFFQFQIILTVVERLMRWMDALRVAGEGL